jgi:hypothetical protein
MKPTLNEKLIAYLALLSGLTLSIVAEYYSILGLTAIFAAAVIPVIIMGAALGVSKVTATLWLKQNWKIAPYTVRTYLAVAIAVLMLVTSMGIFGFLSKAHSDQSLVSGDVLAKVAIYDEKIKTSKENIDASRKALKQLDEAVDQVMGRSSDEKGADKAVAIRRGQTKDRARLLQEISTEQKAISGLNAERAPIAAEVRKVEAEVGPIKYIAAFVYGATDESILEKAVTWVIITIIVVFDPMALILLLASQISFQNFRERRKEIEEGNSPGGTTEVVDSEPPTVTEQEETTEGDSPEKESDVVSTATVTEQEVAEVEPLPQYEADDGPLTDEQTEQVKETVIDNSTSTEQPFDFAAHPYLFNKPVNTTPPGIDPVPHQVHTPVAAEVTYNPPVAVSKREETRMMRTKVFPRRVPEPVTEAEPVEEPVTTSFGLENYIQNEEQNESNLWTTMNPEEFINSSQEERDDHIANIVAAVKARTMEMSDVPELLQNDVKARV